MLVKDYPFIRVAPGPARPMLWIRVANPDTQLAVIALAIVDTGADDCLFPAETATELGHNLKAVPPYEVGTASRPAKVYEHTSQVDILEMLPNRMPGNKVLYTIPDTPIGFVEDGENFLLGVMKFLSNFVLTIDYPRQVFSIRKPRKK